MFRDFPLPNHGDAQVASEAAQCAGEQKKFWEYHDKIFENQRQLKEPDLKRYAEELSLDTAAFNECLDSGKFTEDVKRDYREGSAAGVNSTPAFFVNGRVVTGAQPFEAFAQIIDEELELAK